MFNKVINAKQMAITFKDGAIVDFSDAKVFDTDIELIVLRKGQDSNIMSVYMKSEIMRYFIKTMDLAEVFEE